MTKDSDTFKMRKYDRLRMCTNTRAGDLLPSCGMRGAKELLEQLQREIGERGDFIKLETVHCLGKCHIGPTLKLLPGGPFLQCVTSDKASEVAELLQAEQYDQLAERFADPDQGSSSF